MYLLNIYWINATMPLRFSTCLSINYIKYGPLIFLLLREVVTEAPEMRSVHFVKSMELTMDIMGKGNVIHCNTCQYVGWHELGLYPHL